MATPNRSALIARLLKVIRKHYKPVPQPKDRTVLEHLLFACLVEDSGEGMCYLVVGGEWGLRLKTGEDDGPWGLDRGGQWGESFLLLAGNAQEVRFAG